MYHLSLQKLENDELFFVPRIPKTAGVRENKTIPRICVSTTIQGCVDAVLTCHIKDALEECCYSESHELFFDVYTPSVQLNQEDIVLTETIIEKDYVHDARRTSELWIVKPIKMEWFATYRVSNVIESYDWLKYADFGMEDFPYKIKYELVCLPEKEYQST